MALGRLDNSDVVFDLYHESSKFVPPSSFGLLIMSKCTEMARQPSHWVNLNGSNLQRGEASRKGRREGGTFSASALKALPNPSPYPNEPISPP